jgi:hypothetical protein
MPQHEVIAHLPLHAMTNEDFTIEVRSNNKLIGDLTNSQGRVTWHPAGKHSSYVMGWERFNRMMQDDGSEK